MVRTIVSPIAAAMPDASPTFADRLAALAFLGLARWLEWQALHAQASLVEWSQARREWQHVRPWLPDGEAFTYDPIWNFTDVATMWCMGGIRGQLTAAQGLLAHCALPYLDLPSTSGRRHGVFDPGRRRNAVVINFPDRRRPEPIS